MKRSLILACLITLPFAQIATARSITVAGQNGGTADISRDCTRGQGQAQCQMQTTATGAQGKTVLRDRLRTTVKGSSTVTINRTGVTGKSHSRSRVLTGTP